MSDPRLRLLAPVSVLASSKPNGPTRPLGRHLVDAGVITSGQLVSALEAQIRLDAPLGDILIAEGLAQEDQILNALAHQSGLMRTDLEDPPIDARLADLRPAEFWLRHRAAPWMRLGQTVVIATEHPGQVDAIKADLPDIETLFAIAPEPRVMGAIARLFRIHLATKAETRPPPDHSCRHWTPPTKRALAAAILVLAACLIGLLVAPIAILATVCGIALLTLTLISGLKLAGFATQLLGALQSDDQPPQTSEGRLPRISVMVPLYQETEIAEALIRRLSCLTYPKALLNVVLVLEEKDTQTRDILNQTVLPPGCMWSRCPIRGIA